jgi:bifunctional non-homologous end joining protein LigD
MHRGARRDHGRVGARQLDEYQRKRDFARTSEPAGDAASPSASDDEGRRFVVQEHHARSLHWDLRLEHDGVLLSWAVPKGIPMLNKPDHLAVHTEDHPLEYLTFEGEIPTGEYGAGTMTIWDSGTYEAEKLRDDEVIVTLHGRRVRAKFALFRTRGDQWMIHRMSPPDDPDRRRVPDDLRPMRAVSGKLPRADAEYGYEMKWDGVRALVTVEGGRVRLTSRAGNDMTARYPELRALGDVLGTTEAVLDGEIVALDEDGRPSFEVLQRRMNVASDSAVRRLVAQVPVVIMLFDVLWLEGHSTMDLPYTDRRALLERLSLSGPHWQTPPTTPAEGEKMRAAAEGLGLEGVVAKRLDSTYQPGRRSPAWIKVKSHQGQELVVGGWLPGNGRLEARLGSLLVGYHALDDADGPGGPLRYAGRVGSGIDEQARTLLEERLAPHAREESPFVDAPRIKDARFVSPRLVVAVEFYEWTKSGVLRAPRYKGLRDDVDPGAVVREPTG